MASPDVDLNTVLCQGKLVTYDLVTRTKRKPFRMIPRQSDSDEVERFRDLLREQPDELKPVWQEYNRILEEDRRIRGMFADEAVEEDEYGEDVCADGDEYDGRPNEFDLNDPFINDNAIETEPKTRLTKRQKMDKVMSAIDRKREELKRLEAKLSNLADDDD